MRLARVRRRGRVLARVWTLARPTLGWWPVAMGFARAVGRTHGRPDGMLELLSGHRGSGLSASNRARTSGEGGGGFQSGGAPGGGCRAVIV